MNKIEIKGMFWSAGDLLFVDKKNEDGSWDIRSLNDYMKENVKENTNIVITIEEMDSKSI